MICNMVVSSQKTIELSTCSQNAWRPSVSYQTVARSPLFRGLLGFGHQIHDLLHVVPRLLERRDAAVTLDVSRAGVVAGQSKFDVALLGFEQRAEVLRPRHDVFARVKRVRD